MDADSTNHALVMDDGGVIVHAPPMTVGGTILLDQDEYDALQTDLKNLRLAVDNFARMLICLIVLHDKDGSNSVVITREIIERAKNSKISLSGDSFGNITAQVVQRASSLVVVEGRG